MLVATCWKAAATMYPSLEFPYEFIPKYACRHLRPLVWKFAHDTSVARQLLLRDANLAGWAQAMVLVELGLDGAVV